MTAALVVAWDLAGTTVLGGLGVLIAQQLRRRTTLSIHNVYLVATPLTIAFIAAAVTRWWPGALAMWPLAAGAICAAVTGRGWRLSDLGAGEELRQYELARRWIWQAAAAAAPGERTYIAGQGEIVRVRPWPTDVEYVPMSAHETPSSRLPLGEGRHVFICGGTGAGKTTSARRLLAARTLAHGAAALLIDQKGDPADELELRRLAAAAGRPFVLFDPRGSDTDRWQPLWGAPADVAARAVEPIKTSEPYYADVLRQHLNLIVAVLHAAGRWPPSFPLLVDAAGADRFETIEALAAGLDSDEHQQLQRRVENHAEWVGSREARRDLAGGLIRLELVMGAAWRDVLTPRPTPDGDSVAVCLVDAIRQGAVVMWRTYADDMADEAAAITVLALADLHAAAGQAGVPWTLMLDEFGAVIHMAAARGVAILQRARSHHGQVIVITQSVADIEALSQQPGLLGSLSDNFTAFVAHHQQAPDSRDWLAKLMGTRAIWQSTDQTHGHGAGHSGKGSRRRVREFRIGADQFASLRRGQAIIYTTLGPDPAAVNVLAVQLPDAPALRIGTGQPHPAEIPVHPEDTLSEIADHQPPAVSEVDLEDA